jgi:hypothetical protein
MFRKQTILCRLKYSACEHCAIDRDDCRSIQTMTKPLPNEPEYLTALRREPVQKVFADQEEALMVCDMTVINCVIATIILLRLLNSSEGRDLTRPNFFGRINQDFFERSLGLPARLSGIDASVGSVSRHRSRCSGRGIFCFSPRFRQRLGTPKSTSDQQGDTGIPGGYIC